MKKENDGKAVKEEDEEQDYVNHLRPPPPPPPPPQPSPPLGSKEEDDDEDDDDDYVPYRRPPPPPPPPSTPADKSYTTEGLYENQDTVGRVSNVLCLTMLAPRRRAFVLGRRRRCRVESGKSIRESFRPGRFSGHECSKYAI